jgi:hypothetical protein
VKINEKLYSPVAFAHASLNLALQKVTRSIKMVPSGIKIGKEQLSVSACADDIAINGKMKEKYNFL